MPNVSSLQVVLIDNPAAQWDHPLVRNLLYPLWGMKLRGYRTTYANEDLPVDGTDFFGTHIIYCIKQDIGLTPALAYRSVTLDQCRRHHSADFPLLRLLEASKATDHARVVRGMVEKATRENLSIRYCSSYTIEPGVRDDREFVHALKDVFAGLHPQFILDSRTDISLLLGAVAKKTDRMFESWGYEYLRSAEGQTLPNLSLDSLSGSEAATLLFKGPSEYSRAMALKYSELWKNRIVVGDITRESPHSLPAAANYRK